MQLPLPEKGLIFSQLKEAALSQVAMVPIVAIVAIVADVPAVSDLMIR